jgi:hypothetical protein
VVEEFWQLATELEDFLPTCTSSQCPMNRPPSTLRTEANHLRGRLGPGSRSSREPAWCTSKHRRNTTRAKDYTLHNTQLPSTAALLPSSLPLRGRHAAEPYTALLNIRYQTLFDGLIGFDFSLANMLRRHWALQPVSRKTKTLERSVTARLHNHRLRRERFWEDFRKGLGTMMEV